MTHPYIEHLENCFAKAEKRESKITPEIIAMEGMTGTKTRHFYNNLLSMPDARYLEIGCWKGSSCCSAMCGNKAHVTIIDNFAGFGSPREECMANIEKFKGENEVTFIEQDCFTVEVSQFKYRFNIYLIDGDHSAQSQYDSIVRFIDAMEDVSIIVVDDWNFSEVRDGTWRAINSPLALKILYFKEIILTTDNSHTPADIAKETWHNGMAAFVLKKKS